MKQIDLPKGWLVRVLEQECREPKNWPKCLLPLLYLNSELNRKYDAEQQNEGEK